MDIGSYFKGQNLPLTLIVLGIGLNMIDTITTVAGSTNGGKVFGTGALLGGLDNAIGFNAGTIYVNPGGELVIIGLGLWLWHKFGR